MDDALIGGQPEVCAPVAPVFASGEGQPRYLLESADAHCPACGYAVSGVKEAGRCPECGLEFDALTFVVRGMASGLSRMLAGRASLWVIVIVIAVIASQTWHLLFVLGRDLLPLAGAAFLAWLGVLLWLLVTGKGDTSGVVPLYFSRARFGYFHAERPDASVTHTWPEVGRVFVTEVSPFWHKLRITGRNGSTLLKAGFRANAHNANAVRTLIRMRVEDSRHGGASSCR